jgi:hypothetical protein
VANPAAAQEIQPEPQPEVLQQPNPAPVPAQNPTPAAEGPSEAAEQAAAAATAGAGGAAAEVVRERFSGSQLLGSALKGAAVAAVGVVVTSAVAAAVPVLVPMAAPVVGGTAVASGTVAGAAGAKTAAAAVGMAAAGAARWLLDAAFPPRPGMVVLPPPAAVVEPMAAAAPHPLSSPEMAANISLAGLQPSVARMVPPLQQRAAEMLGAGSRIHLAPGVEELLRRGPREALRPFPGMERRRGGGGAAVGTEGTAAAALPEGLWARSREATRSWLNRMLGTAPEQPQPAAAGGGWLGQRTENWLQQAEKRMEAMGQAGTFREIFRQVAGAAAEGVAPTTAAGWVATGSVAAPQLDAVRPPRWVERWGVLKITGALNSAASALGWVWNNGDTIALVATTAKAAPLLVPAAMLITGNVGGAARICSGIVTRLLLGPGAVEQPPVGVAEHMGRAWKVAHQEMLAATQDPVLAGALEKSAELFLLH